jgi:hypothetical protein
MFFWQLQRILKPRGHVFMLFPLETAEEMNLEKPNWHLVHFDGLGAFRKYIKSDIWEILYLDMSDKAGCLKNQREALFVGRLK